MNRLLLLIFLSASALAAEKAPILTMCDVLARPMEFDGKEVIISGRMYLSFEHFTFGCRERALKMEPLSSIWISFDLPSILKASPSFEEKAREDEANVERKHVIREITVRARLQFSKQMIDDPSKAPAFSGFGHMGMSPGQATVLQILEYGPNQSPQPTQASGTRG